MNVASQAIFVAVSFLFMMWFLYAVNFTIMAFTFWGMGLFLAASLFFVKETIPTQSPPYQGGEKEGIRSVFKEIRIFTSPPKTFLFSLLIVGLMALSVIGIYFEANRYIAEIYFARANYVSAIRFWQYDERYFQGLSQSIFLQYAPNIGLVYKETVTARSNEITFDANGEPIPVIDRVDYGLFYTQRFLQSGVN